MGIIDRPAFAGQESTDQPNRSVEDEEPASVPAVLSPEMQERARAALVLYAKGKTPRNVAEALGYAPMYVRAVLRGELDVTVHFAAQIARVLGTDIHALVNGNGT
jgi:hypothetical protein